MRSRGLGRSITVTVPLVAACVSACALFTDLDGFSRPTVDAGTVVDANDVVRPPSGDADAGPDTGADSGSSGALACSRKHTFCEDFDGTDPFGAWKAKLVDAQGTLNVVTNRSLSPPASLHATLPRRPDEPVDRSALVTRVWDQPWERIVVEMDVFLEAPTWKDGDVNVALAAIELSSESTKIQANLIMNRTFAQVGSSFLAYANGPAFPTDRWTHVRMEVDPAGATVAGAFDGVAFETATFARRTPGASPRIELAIGLNGYNTPAPAVSVHYDNITVDLGE